jgi:hypothetical protein
MAHDLAVEDWLKRNGYEFRFEKKAPLAHIDIAKAADNPSRLHRKLDNDLAYQYAEDYQRGADFPALVVQEIVGQPLWELWGGLHRYSGCDTAGLPNHDCIVVIGETEPARIELARRVLNSIGVGKGETVSGKLQHINELRKQFRHLTIEQLSEHFRVRKSTITKYLHVIASEERADRLGEGSFWNYKASQEMKIEAGRLTSDEVFVAIIDLTKNHQLDMRGETGVEYVKKLRGMTSDRARLASIIDKDKELSRNDEERKTGRKRGPTSRTTRYLYHIRCIGADFPKTAADLHLGDQGTCATLRRLRKEAIAAQDRLMDIVAEYSRLIVEAEKVEAWRANRHGDSHSEHTSLTH